LKHLGLGVGYNYIQMDLDYSGDDDFLSEIDLTNGGVLAYAKLFFKIPPAPFRKLTCAHT